MSRCAQSSPRMYSMLLRKRRLQSSSSAQLESVPSCLIRLESSTVMSRRSMGSPKRARRKAATPRSYTTLDVSTKSIKSLTRCSRLHDVLSHIAHQRQCLDVLSSIESMLSDRMDSRVRKLMRTCRTRRRPSSLLQNARFHYARVRQRSNCRISTRVISSINIPI